MAELTAKEPTERRMLTGFIVGAAIMLLALTAAWLAAQRFIEDAKQARRVTGIVSRVEQLHAAFGDLMTSQYGWLGTGNDAFLAERQVAADTLKAQSALLLQEAPLATIELQAQARSLVAALQSNTQAVTAIETSTSADAAVWEEMHQRDTHIKALIATLLSNERDLYKQQVVKTRDQIFWVYAMVVLAAVVALLVLGSLLWRSRRDLRQRLAMEGHLQAANRLLESLLDSIPAMVFAKDAQDLRFIRMNRMGEQLLGLRREELLGKSDRDFFPKEQADYFIARDRETLAKMDILDIPQEEIDSVHRGRRILHTHKVPIRNEYGQPIMLLGISMDITEQKAAEQRIVSLNEELTRQAQLLQSSNQELESFCYSVSHDLRAPLRAINGYARLLEQDYGSRFDAEGARFLRTICAACDRMARLIDDLLEFSRLGRQTLQLEPVDMTTMVNKVIDDTVEGRDTPPPTIATKPLPSIRGDRNLLHLVWLNLIDNAVKYTSGVASPHIYIGAEIANDEIVYSVTDNGIGFDMQYADKLFGVFQRLHTDVKYPGTGVGLAIAHRIVARHGGRIWAQSEPGRGSTFSFAMPLNTRQAATELH